MGQTKLSPLNANFWKPLNSNGSFFGERNSKQLWICFLGRIKCGILQICYNNNLLFAQT